MSRESWPRGGKARHALPRGGYHLVPYLHTFHTVFCSLVTTLPGLCSSLSYVTPCHTRVFFSYLLLPPLLFTPSNFTTQLIFRDLRIFSLLYVAPCNTCPFFFPAPPSRFLHSQPTFTLPLSKSWEGGKVTDEE